MLLFNCATGMVVRDATRNNRVGVIQNIDVDPHGCGRILLETINKSRKWTAAPNNLIKLLDSCLPTGVTHMTLNGVLTLLSSFNNSVIQLQVCPDLYPAMVEEVRKLRGQLPAEQEIYVDHETAKIKPNLLRGRVCFDSRLIKLVEAAGARVSWSENDQAKGHKARAYEWWFVAEALRTTTIPIGCSNEWSQNED